MHDSRAGVLIVHLGGLGDICLAESIFLSLHRHFGPCLAGLGNRRFLDLFGSYFTKAYGVESRHWLYLFSEKLTGPDFRRIIFIGKDRQGSIRKRWASYSREELIFIDMYPEGSFPDPRASAVPSPHERLHIEEYQLRQLGAFGIEPVKAGVGLSGPGPVILYPEKGFAKGKWPAENFLAVRDHLARDGIDTVVLRPADMELPGETIVIHELSKVKELFSRGGAFVSNDSGMAHLAGACGLATITVFTDFDPAVWHPRGQNISLKQGIDDVDPAAIARMIKALPLS
jgi:ADP-heptose:LPS heptosyltransferase